MFYHIESPQVKARNSKFKHGHQGIRAGYSHGGHVGVFGFAWPSPNPKNIGRARERDEQGFTLALATLVLGFASLVLAWNMAYVRRCTPSVRLNSPERERGIHC